MLLYYILQSGLWRSMDLEKFRLFFGWTPRLYLSRYRPPWRSLPWGAAVFSPRRAREIHAWLEYRVKLYDGEAG